MSSFGKYRLLAQIGEGGMAEVFLAVVAGPRGSGFSKLTVIKRLRANIADDPEFIDMLVDEARIAARLNHPNVVQTHEVGDVDGKYYLAMEYLDGQSLNRIQNLSMARNRKAAQDATLTPSPLTKEMQYVVLLDVLAGLHHAHELTDYDGTAVKIVHRDVTPQNVFVVYEGQAKVVDFGIAKAVGRAAETRHGVVKGKARYMAPEQALGGDVDRRADVFSVGALLWESAAGTRRWKDQSEAEIVRALLSDGGYTPVRAVDPTVPEEIEAICKKALSADPNERYETAEEFRKALEAHLVASGKLLEARAGLGAAVAELCKDSRAELKGVIEKQLKNLNGEAAPLVLTLQAGERDRSSRRELSMSSVPPTTTVTDAGVGVTNMTAATPQKSGSKKALVFGALAVAAIVTVAGVVVQKRSSDARAAAKAAVTAETTPLSTDVAVSVTASPKNAQIIVDGKPVGSSYEAKVPKSSAPHTVRVEAEGYEAQTQNVVFERDVTLSIALAKAVVTAPSAMRASTPAVGAGAPVVAWTPPPPKATSKPTAASTESTNPAPRETASAPASPGSVAAAPGAATARQKKDIDRANPFSNTSSGAGPAKTIDKTNPFGN